eukprot:g15220.t1
MRRRLSISAWPYSHPTAVSLSSTREACGSSHDVAEGYSSIELPVRIPGSGKMFHTRRERLASFKEHLAKEHNDCDPGGQHGASATRHVRHPRHDTARGQLQPECSEIPPERDVSVQDTDVFRVLYLFGYQPLRQGIDYDSEDMLPLFSTQEKKYFEEVRLKLLEYARAGDPGSNHKAAHASNFQLLLYSKCQLINIAPDPRLGLLTVEILQLATSTFSHSDLLEADARHVATTPLENISTWYDQPFLMSLEFLAKATWTYRFLMLSVFISSLSVVSLAFSGARQDPAYFRLWFFFFRWIILSAFVCFFIGLANVVKTTNYAICLAFPRYKVKPSLGKGFYGYYKATSQEYSNTTKTMTEWNEPFEGLVPWSFVGGLSIVLHLVYDTFPCYEAHHASKKKSEVIRGEMLSDRIHNENLGMDVALNFVERSMEPEDLVKLLGDLKLEKYTEPLVSADFGAKELIDVALIDPKLVCDELRLAGIINRGDRFRLPLALRNHRKAKSKKLFFEGPQGELVFSSS